MQSWDSCPGRSRSGLAARCNGSIRSSPCRGRRNASSSPAPDLEGVRRRQLSRSPPGLLAGCQSDLDRRKSSPVLPDSDAQLLDAFCQPELGGLRALAHRRRKEFPSNATSKFISINSIVQVVIEHGFDRRTERQVSVHRRFLSVLAEAATMASGSAGPRCPPQRRAHFALRAPRVHHDRRPWCGDATGWMLVPLQKPKLVPNLRGPICSRPRAWSLRLPSP